MRKWGIHHAILSPINQAYREVRGEPSSFTTRMLNKTKKGIEEPKGLSCLSSKMENRRDTK